MKDTDKQPDEEMCRVRYGRDLSIGPSDSMELAVSPSQCGCICQLGSNRGMQVAPLKWENLGIWSQI